MSARRWSWCAPTRQPKPICARRSACSHGCDQISLLLNGAGLAVTGRKFGAYDGYGHEDELALRAPDAPRAGARPARSRRPPPWRRTRRASAMALWRPGALRRPATDGRRRPAMPGRATRRPRRRSGRRSRVRESRPISRSQQVLSADLGSGGETLDLYQRRRRRGRPRSQTRRVTAQVSYRYERDIDWRRRSSTRMSIPASPWSTLEVVPACSARRRRPRHPHRRRRAASSASPIATRHVDVYSALCRPDPVDPCRAARDQRLLPPRLRQGRRPQRRRRPARPTISTASTAHSATASVGMAPGAACRSAGRSAPAMSARITAGRFDQRFRGQVCPRRRRRAGRADPRRSPAASATRTSRSSQRDFVRDASGAAGDRPERPPDRRSQRAAPARPTTVDGLIYDGGIIWRPSPRTELQARAGHRYGGTTFTGSFGHQINEHHGVSAAVYDRSRRFGHGLTNDLSGLPTSFEVNRNPLTGGLGGCVFGHEPGSGACLDDRSQSITGVNLPQPRRQPGLLRRARPVELRRRRRLCQSQLSRAGHARRSPLYGVDATRAGRVHGNRSAASSAAPRTSISTLMRAGIDSGIAGADRAFERRRDGQLLPQPFLRAAAAAWPRSGSTHSDDGTDSATNASASPACATPSEAGALAETAYVHRPLRPDRAALPADPGRALLVRQRDAPEGDGLSRLRPGAGRGLHRHHRRDRRGQVDAGRAI